MTKYDDNHFTPSDHNAITRAKYILDQAKESLKINSKNNNKFNPSDEKMSSNKVTHIIEPQKTPITHPIINLCQSYIESVFFQLDSAPSSSGTLQFLNHKKGRIVKFTYFLDSSMGNGVQINLDLISPNNCRKSLIKYVQGGNTFILGTFNSTVLEFKLNQKIEVGEQIQITYSNGSANDCTIMSIADIKYGEEDF